MKNKCWKCGKVLKNYEKAGKNTDGMCRCGAIQSKIPVTNSLSRIEKEWYRIFYATNIDKSKNQKEVDSYLDLRSGIGSSQRAKKEISFIRQQILALLDDVEGELPKEERSCKNCSELTFDVNCPYCGCGIFKVKNRFIRLSDVKTILDNYKKEIQK